MIDNYRLYNFPWPTSAKMSARPVWRGDAFLVGTEKRRILEFGQSESHWSPELTVLHEEEAGANHPIDRASRELAVASLKQFVTVERPVILDVGSSSGYVLTEIQRALPDAALIGSDYLLPPLLTLAKKMPELPILQFDLRHCPLPDNCVDAVTALNVLEHVDQDEQGLAQIYRILRPGGVVHIEVPAGPGLFDIYDELLLHHRRYRLRDLTAMARRVGFELLRKTHLGFVVFPAFWFAKKRNRRHLPLSNTKKRDIVAAQIRGSQRSKLLDSCLALERRFGRKLLSYPWGIRCIVVGRKEPKP
jgi:ubiquinone/menaquinone biosynthesis C-methylase UbiE